MTMAIRVHRTGGPEELRWEEISTPEPSAGEVRVRNAAVAVNMLDIYQRIGRPHPNQPAFPYTPGGIHVGRIEQLGEGVTDLRAGERVVCMGHFGAYSEATVVAADRVVALPGDLPDAEVAAIFVRGLAAYYLTHLHHRVEPGQTFLVHAAAGGLGQLLTRWIVHRGGRVVGTVGAQDKVPIATAAGCDKVIVRTEADVVSTCAAYTGGQGVDVVYDSVGRDTVHPSIACVRAGGHVVVCGAASGTVENFSLEWLHASSCKISRPTVGTYVRTREQLKTAADAVFEAMRAGVLRLQAVRSFSLRDAPLAHRALESRAATGTPVLIP